MSKVFEHKAQALQAVTVIINHKNSHKPSLAHQTVQGKDSGTACASV
jgi:hypothetical protein